jgi:hypothetical protein
MRQGAGGSPGIERLAGPHPNPLPNFPPHCVVDQVVGEIGGLELQLDRSLSPAKARHQDVVLHLLGAQRKRRHCL